MNRLTGTVIPGQDRSVIAMKGLSGGAFWLLLANFRSPYLHYTMFAAGRGTIDRGAVEMGLAKDD
jgi:hypothetical protein